MTTLIIIILLQPFPVDIIYIYIYVCLYIYICIDTLRISTYSIIVTLLSPPNLFLPECVMKSSKSVKIISEQNLISCIWI